LCDSLVVPESFVEGTIILLLNGFDTFVENKLAIDVWVYLLALNCIHYILMLYVSALIAVLNYFDYRTLYSNIKLRNVSAFQFFFPFPELFWLFRIPYYFSISLSIYEKKKVFLCDFDRKSELIFRLFWVVLLSSGKSSIP
jgi:hypothetical protein